MAAYNAPIAGHDPHDHSGDDIEIERAQVVAIGQRLRAEREVRGMTVRDLARRVGVSASLISQIETGKAQPSVGTLYSLTRVLRIPVDRLFATADEGDRESDDRPPVPPALDHLVPRLVVRSRQRKVIDLDSGVRWERLTSTNHPDVDFLYVVYRVGGASSDTLMRHAGREFGIVLQGVLTVTVNFEDHVLDPGDSIAFPSTTPHRLWNAGSIPAHAIWVVVGRHGVSGASEGVPS